MVRRSRLEIYFDLLRVVDRGVSKPTRIMYKTNLSWKTLMEILDVLISKGFIREAIFRSSKRYHITEKGLNALSYYNKSMQGLVANNIFVRT